MQRSRSACLIYLALQRPRVSPVSIPPDRRSGSSLATSAPPPPRNMRRRTRTPSSSYQV